MLVRVSVRGNRAGGQGFEEQTETVAVSAHGALILLSASVEAGAELKLRHRTTLEEVRARVACLGPKRGGKLEIGVEFAEPSPRFWRVTFPPDDWSLNLPRGDPQSGEIVRPRRGR